MVLLVSIVGAGAFAQESATISTNAVPLPEQTALYAGLNVQVIELQTEFRLLSVLAEVHRQRAQELERDQPEKAKWEGELAKALGGDASITLTQLSGVTARQLAFEQAHPAMLAPLRTLGALGITNGPGPEANAYLAMLEQRAELARQELIGIVEAGRLLAAQFRTNLNSLDFARVSAQVQENGFLARQIQKEQSDLELRRLEFLALRRY